MNTWVKDINYICQAPATAYTRAGVAHDWHVASSLTAASTPLYHSQPPRSLGPRWPGHQRPLMGSKKVPGPNPGTRTSSGFMSRTRMPLASATFCADVIRRKVFTRAFATALGLREP